MLPSTAQLHQYIHDTDTDATQPTLPIVKPATESAFDRLTRLSVRLLGVPVALVTLFDGDTLRTITASGVHHTPGGPPPTPLSDLFCKYIMASRKPLIIPDVRTHPLTKDNPDAGELNLIAYAGIPLLSPSGKAVGSFGAIDSQPRDWPAEDVAVLEDLAASAMTEITLRTELQERGRVESRMRETSAKYEALFERSLDAVFIYDFDGSFLDANDAALRLLGYTRQEIAMMHFSTFLAPTQKARAREWFAEINATGSQQSGAEFRLRTRAGKYVYMEIMASVIHLDGQPWGIQGIARDISQRKRAEAALRKAYTKEKELGALRSNFMSMVSHDFRIPLSVIQSSSDLLKRYQDRMTEEQQARHWDKIQSQVIRLADMLTSVLTLSKATDNNLKPAPTQVNWESFGRTLADEVQLSSGGTNHIVYQYQGAHADGTADEQLLHRAIANLLSNAVKYSQHDGAIYFDVESTADTVMFRVKDEGIGIADGDKDRLFDTFFRAGNVGSVPGSGLGLAIVRQAVTVHGGTIKVDSHLGAGSVFTVTIPRHLPQTPKADS